MGISALLARRYKENNLPGTVLLYQKHLACKYVRKKGGKNYFDRLDPILCKVATRDNDWGIVYR
jgi:hypothetical protein